MKAYSMDYRKAVARAYDACGSSLNVARQFGCSESWVRRLIQRRRETGSLEPQPHQTPDRSKLNERDLEKLAELIRKRPDMTLAELADALNNKVSIPTVCRATKSLGLTLKKRLSTRPSKIARTSRRRVKRGSISFATSG